MQPRKLVPFNTDSLNITINDHVALESFFASRKDKGGAIGHDVETTMHEDFFNRKMRTSQFGDQKEQHVQDLLELCDGDAESARSYAQPRTPYASRSAANERRAPVSTQRVRA